MTKKIVGPTIEGAEKKIFHSLPRSGRNRDEIAEADDWQRPIVISEPNLRYYKERTELLSKKIADSAEVAYGALGYLAQKFEEKGVGSIAELGDQENLKLWKVYWDDPKNKEFRYHNMPLFHTLAAAQWAVLDAAKNEIKDAAMSPTEVFNPLSFVERMPEAYKARQEYFKQNFTDVDDTFLFELDPLWLIGGGLEKLGKTILTNEFKALGRIATLVKNSKTELGARAALSQAQGALINDSAIKLIKNLNNPEGAGKVLYGMGFRTTMPYRIIKAGHGIVPNFFRKQFELFPPQLEQDAKELFSTKASLSENLREATKMMKTSFKEILGHAPSKYEERKIIEVLKNVRTPRTLAPGKVAETFIADAHKIVVDGTWAEKMPFDYDPKIVDAAAKVRTFTKEGWKTGEAYLEAYFPNKDVPLAEWAGRVRTREKTIEASLNDTFLAKAQELNSMRLEAQQVLEYIPKEKQGPMINLIQHYDESIEGYKALARRIKEPEQVKGSFKWVANKLDELGGKPPLDKNKPANSFDELSTPWRKQRKSFDVKHAEETSYIPLGLPLHAVDALMSFVKTGQLTMTPGWFLINAVEGAFKSMIVGGEEAAKMLMDPKTFKNWGAIPMAGKRYNGAPLEFKQTLTSHLLGLNDVPTDKLGKGFKALREFADNNETPARMIIGQISYDKDFKYLISQGVSEIEADRIAYANADKIVSNTMFRYDQFSAADTWLDKVFPYVRFYKSNAAWATRTVGQQPMAAVVFGKVAKEFNDNVYADYMGDIHVPGTNLAINALDFVNLNRLMDPMMSDDFKDWESVKPAFPVKALTVIGGGFNPVLRPAVAKLNSEDYRPERVPGIQLDRPRSEDRVFTLLPNYSPNAPIPILSVIDNLSKTINEEYALPNAMKFQFFRDDIDQNKLDFMNDLACREYIAAKKFEGQDVTYSQAQKAIAYSNFNKALYQWLFNANAVDDSPGHRALKEEKQYIEQYAPLGDKDAELKRSEEILKYPQLEGLIKNSPDDDVKKYINTLEDWDDEQKRFQFFDGLPLKDQTRVIEQAPISNREMLADIIRNAGDKFGALKVIGWLGDALTGEAAAQPPNFEKPKVDETKWAFKPGAGFIYTGERTDMSQAATRDKNQKYKTELGWLSDNLKVTSREAVKNFIRNSPEMRAHFLLDENAKPITNDDGTIAQYANSWGKLSTDYPSLRSYAMGEKPALDTRGIQNNITVVGQALRALISKSDFPTLTSIKDNPSSWGELFKAKENELKGLGLRLKNIGYLEKSDINNLLIDLAPTIQNRQIQLASYPFDDMEKNIKFQELRDAARSRFAEVPLILNSMPKEWLGSYNDFWGQAAKNSPIETVNIMWKTHYDDAANFLSSIMPQRANGTREGVSWAALTAKLADTKNWAIANSIRYGLAGVRNDAVAEFFRTNEAQGTLPVGKDPITGEPIKFDATRLIAEGEIDFKTRHFAPEVETEAYGGAPGDIAKFQAHYENAIDGTMTALGRAGFSYEDAKTLWKDFGEPHTIDNIDPRPAPQAPQRYRVLSDYLHGVANATAQWNSQNPNNKYSLMTFAAMHLPGFTELGTTSPDRPWHDSPELMMNVAKDATTGRELSQTMMNAASDVYRFGSAVGVISRDQTFEKAISGAAMGGTAAYLGTQLAYVGAAAYGAAAGSFAGTGAGLGMAGAMTGLASTWAVPVVGAVIFAGMGIAYGMGMFGGDDSAEEEAKRQQEMYVKRQAEYEAYRQAQIAEENRQQSIRSIVTREQSLARAFKETSYQTQKANAALQIAQFRTKPTYSSRMGLLDALTREMSTALKPRW